MALYQDALDQHVRLDALIAGLASADATAIGEYEGIVLANSVYPEVVEVLCGQLSIQTRDTRKAPLS